MLSLPVVIGWSFFGASVIISQILSLFIVLWLKRPSSHNILYIAIGIPLCFSFLILFIIPVDVFFISFMKDSSGNFKPWAEDPKVRNTTIKAITASYYFLYATTCFLIYVVYPLVLFAFNEDPEDDDAPRFKIKRAIIFTSASILLMICIFIVGLFIPDSTGIKTSGLLYIMIQDNSILKRMSKGLGFHIFIIQLLGFLVSVCYTAYGLSILPLKCLDVRFKKTTDSNVAISQDFQYESLVNNEERESEVSESRPHKNCCSKFLRIIIAPFRIIFGLITFACSVLIISSLIITCIDKWINSGGVKTGYYLQDPKLFNPLDYLFLKCQTVFPVDYILIGFIFCLFGLSSISAIKRIGIRIMLIRIFNVRTRGTNSHSLVLFALFYNFMCISSGYLFWNILTDYMTYGNQKYHFTDPVNNSTVVARCTRSTSSDHCIMTSFAKIIYTLNLNSNFVGAVMFYLHQFFALWFVVGFFYSIYSVFIKNHTEDIDSLEVDM